MNTVAAARLQNLQRLRRLVALRQAQAQRLLLAARGEEMAAESVQRQITARIDGLRDEETRCMRLACDAACEGAGIAALQAAQLRGAQLRREVEAEQQRRLAAEQRLQRRRAEREHAAQRQRAQQTRQDWLDRTCRHAQARLRSVRAAAGDAALFEIEAARRALA
jgi:hypothetical protein